MKRPIDTLRAMMTPMESENNAILVKVLRKVLINPIRQKIISFVIDQLLFSKVTFNNSKMPSSIN